MFLIIIVIIYCYKDSYIFYLNFIAYGKVPMRIWKKYHKRWVGGYYFRILCCNTFFKILLRLKYNCDYRKIFCKYNTNDLNSHLLSSFICFISENIFMIFDLTLSWLDAKYNVRVRVNPCIWLNNIIYLGLSPQMKIHKRIFIRLLMKIL